MMHTDAGHKNVLGFWIYLMTDLLMFAVLFATYAVLRTSTFGGPTENELFSLPFVLIETMILLTSSFTVGVAILNVDREKNAIRHVATWLIITFVLGVSFLAMELDEFGKLIADGHNWQSSAFLSSFFSLVGTHGLHIASGLLWILIMLVKMWQRGEINHNTARQITLLSLFWHFLDVVWIFIFSFVYLMGVGL